MKFKGRSYYIRKAHRYLGVFIGIQFVLWTLGGLYFSWTVLDEIHGDHLRHETSMPEAARFTFPPHRAIDEHASGEPADLTKFRMISVMGDPYYSIVYGKGSSARTVMIDAVNGSARGPITEDEAKRIASGAMRDEADIVAAELVTKEGMSGHHEYREKPLPAWAITFKHPENVTAYVGANDGQVHAVRTNNWRAFDFLWMLHTMDFSGRDNINNYLLRTFSILGIVTVLSGFLLFFISSKTIRKVRFRFRDPAKR
ncbi:MAG TPA: PepSY domain-containing protein [Pyrinomonadaceae bacterium]